MFLSDLSIKRPVFATMMILALVVLGIFSYRRLSIDLFPDVEFPFLVIQTRYAGASPESVEREVTKHLEEAVNPVEGVKKIWSTSTEGFSQIFVQFELGTQIMDAQADVRNERHQVAHELAVLAPPRTRANTPPESLLPSFSFHRLHRLSPKWAGDRLGGEPRDLRDTNDPLAMGSIAHLRLAGVA